MTTRALSTRTGTRRMEDLKSVLEESLRTRMRINITERNKERERER